MKKNRYIYTIAKCLQAKTSFREGETLCNVLKKGSTHVLYLLSVALNCNVVAIALC